MPATRSCAAAVPSILRQHMALFCMVALATMAMKMGLADATSRLGATTRAIVAPHRSTEPVVDAQAHADSDPSVLQAIMRTAASSLQATYLSVDPKAPRFPDIADPETGTWHMDAINANGAAGLLAGSLWSMYKLTGSNMWLARARAASDALRFAVNDPSMGQAAATLAYPALRYAYEAESDPEQQHLYLEAALGAATSVAKQFARLPGVIRVQSTALIINELEAIGVAHLHPMTVLSSVEGASAATGLLAWAATLPGGKAAWKEMALSNARHIVTDHIEGDGSVTGTLIYSSVDPTIAPQPLSMGASTNEEVEIASALEEWLSAVAGQTSSPEMRQALAVMALTEALKASEDPDTFDMFASALEATSNTVLALALDPLAMPPAAAAATACALAEIASLPFLTVGDRDEYAVAARHVIVTLAQHSLNGPRPAYLAGTQQAKQQQPMLGQQQPMQQQQQQLSLGDLAAKWLESLIPSTPKQQQQQQQQPCRHASSAASSSSQRFLRGSSQEEAPRASRAMLFGPSSTVAAAADVSQDAPEALSPAILTNADGRGGSMLADYLLLRALTKLTVLDPSA